MRKYSENKIGYRQHTCPFKDFTSTMLLNIVDQLQKHKRGLMPTFLWLIQKMKEEKDEKYKRMKYIDMKVEHV